MGGDDIGVGGVVGIGAAGLYLLLAGEVSAAEVVAAAPVAALAGAYAVALRRNAALRLGFQDRGLRGRAGLAFVRALLGLLPETVLVAARLLRAVRRRPVPDRDLVQHQPFRFGGPDGDDPGRRAAVMAALSLAPNGFVLGTPDDRDALLIHRLVPAPASPDREWPI